MRLTTFVLLSFFLSACSTTQLPITQESYERATKLQQHNNGLKSWDMVASTSLNTEATSYSLTVYWHQLNDHYNLRFDAPFSTGVLKIKGQNGYSEITLDNKKTIQGKKPEDLITQVTKFNIPVTGLIHWVRGIAHQESPYQLQIKGNGDTDTLKQDNWVIEYKGWDNMAINQQTYRLPNDIYLSQNDLKIRIKPSDWVKQGIIKSNPLFSDLSF